jgi:hypothetical protein
MLEMETIVNPNEPSKRSPIFKELPMALAKFQGEITNPKLTANNPHFKSKYAPLAEVLGTVRPVLSKFGLSVYQDIGTLDDKVVITTHLYHESGEYLISSPLYIPASRGGKGMDAQGIGSGASYGKRYQIQAILGIAADEDNDGEDIANHNNYAIDNMMPTNMTPQISKQALAAKWQLGTGSRDGFDDFYNGKTAEGKDHVWIDAAIQKSIDAKKKEAVTS